MERFVWLCRQGQFNYRRPEGEYSFSYSLKIEVAVLENLISFG